MKTPISELLDEAIKNLLLKRNLLKNAAC
ncbi:hypothetical protein ACFOU2_19565 [Bacillus songklensis]|uniref:Uncharacterized protein n=1 Tax=Bacillus songklensis TaxID=1069116 RepID=A0ABV8B6P8_9BACI